MPHYRKLLLTAGIDVSAKTLNVAWRDLKGEISENEFENNESGHSALIRLFRAGKRACQVVLEATGNYHLDLAMALTHAGCSVMVANPLATHHHAASKLRRAKTDRIDAKDLLSFCEKGEFKLWTVPSPATMALRDYARRIQSLIEQMTAEKNRFHAAKAKSGTPAIVLGDIEDSIVGLNKRIRRLEMAAVQLMKSDVQLEKAQRVVTSVKGFAARSAVKILAELLVLPADMTPKQIVAYAGLDPRPFQSGTSVHGKRRISRVGNKRLRAALFMPTMAAVRFEPAVRAAYQALVARKGPTSKLLALTAMSRRLLQVLWQMLRTSQAFDGAKFGSAPRNLPAAA